MHGEIEQRARFEEWAESRRYSTLRHTKREDLYMIDEINMMWRAWQAALASQPQAPAAVVPDGFVLVPITPTDEMLDKANDVKVGGHCYYCSQEYASYGDASRVWAAMLTAAPAPEVGRG